MTEDRFAGLAAFVRLVIEALEATGVEYLVGGAFGLERLWDEPSSHLSG